MKLLYQYPWSQYLLKIQIEGKMKNIAAIGIILFTSAVFTVYTSAKTVKDTNTITTNERIETIDQKRLPWSTESIKAYILKHPSVQYKMTGFDPFEKKKINKIVSCEIKPYLKKFFNNPAGSMYELYTPDESGSLYKWSWYSPFVPNHVPAKNSHKVTYIITGNEQIKTPAGSFDCVIVEIKAQGEDVKAWMIKDKPGIYAKYINAFGYKYILTKIK